MNLLKKYEKTSIILAAIASFLISGYVVYRIALKKAEPLRFGTVLEPDYLIRKNYEADPNFSPFSPIILPRYVVFQDLIANITELLDDSEQDFSTINAQINAQLTSLEESFEKIGAQATYDRMQELDLEKEIRKLTEENLELYNIHEHFHMAYIAESVILNMIPDITPDVSGEEAAKEAFRGLTGKKLPDNVRIEKEDIYWENIVEYYNSLDGRVAYEDLKSVHNLLNLTHAFGHIAAQHAESWTDQSIGEIRILEEACAYAFTRASLDYAYRQAETKELALMGKYLFEENILEEAKSFYNNQDDIWCHGAGAAHLIAVSQVLKDPYKTFNYLATMKNSTIFNLDPRIGEQFVKNKTLFTTNAILVDVMDLQTRVDDRNKSVWPMMDRYGTLIQRCSKAGVTLSAEDIKYTPPKQ